MDTTTTGTETRRCKCGREYRYHGLIVCDACHADTNRREAELDKLDAIAAIEAES